MASRRGRHYYIIDAGASPEIEQVKLVTGFPGGSKFLSGRPAMLFRYGRPVRGFIIGPAQLEKVRRGHGKIYVSERQIEQYDHYASRHGK